MKEFSIIWEEIPTSWKVSFFLCMAVTIGMLLGGFVLPPPGEIHSSVFKGCFIVCIYPTLFTIFICVLRGLHVHYDIKEGQITIGSESDEITPEENGKE